MPRPRRRGFEYRHRPTCPTPDQGANCSCRPAVRAWVWLPGEGRKVRSPWGTEQAAELWYAQAVLAADRGTLATPTGVTVADAADALLETVCDPRASNRAQRLPALRHREPGAQSQ